MRTWRVFIMLTVIGIGQVLLVAAACGRMSMLKQTSRNGSTYQYNTHRHIPVQHTQAYTSRYVVTIIPMHTMIRKGRLEISDKIVDGLKKCFMLVL